MRAQPMTSWEAVSWREVYQGDCVPVMSRWAPGQFDLVFADPPYNASGSNLSWVRAPLPSSALRAS
jgi:16S rRNA G966 N2-methylase RsmD